MKTIEFTYCDDEGEEIEVEFPAKYEVCGRCQGEGKHVNPNIDGHGITMEEWDRDWDDDEREGYFSGRYDVICYECKGEKVVLEVDERAVKADIAGSDSKYKVAWPKYLKHLDNEEDYQRMCEFERRMGC